MQSSPYDFDVVTGPSAPRDDGKDKPGKGDAEKPREGESAVQPPSK
jgi:hypothetical protein